MRKLAYLGVASLSAVALLGISCSSDDNPATATGGTTSATTGGATTNAGGATSTGTKAGGGSSSTAPQTGAGGSPAGGTTSTSPAGGTTGVGGVTGAGGSTAPSTSDAAVTPLTGGLDTTGKFYETGTLKGTVWTAADTAGTKITLAKNEMCVTGTAIKIPNLVLADGGTGGPDYSGAWGADVGFNLNQVEGVDGGDAGPQNPADVSNIASVTLALNGATGMNLRVQLEVKPAADAGTTTSRYFCATLPVAGGTILLRSMIESCWQNGGQAFDPSTMQPTSFAIAIVTSATKEYPINFCVTDLHFNVDQ
jgi:hypothetical protein